MGSEVPFHLTALPSSLSPRPAPVWECPASSRDVAWKAPWAAFMILFARARGAIRGAAPREDVEARRAAGCGRPGRRPRAAATRRARRRTIDHLVGKQAGERGR